MKECKYCKSEIPEDAKVCPVCRKTVSVSLPLAIVVIFISFLLIAFIIYPLLTSGTISTGSTIKLDKDDNKFELINDSGSYDGVTFSIIGEIKNTSNKDYSGVYISFLAYDEDGNEIGDCLTKIFYLNKGDTQKYKAVCSNDSDFSIGERIKNYKLEFIEEEQ